MRGLEGWKTGQGAQAPGACDAERAIAGASPGGSVTGGMEHPPVTKMGLPPAAPGPRKGSAQGQSLSVEDVGLFRVDVEAHKCSGGV